VTDSRDGGQQLFHVPPGLAHRIRRHPQAILSPFCIGGAQQCPYDLNVNLTLHTPTPTSLEKPRAGSSLDFPVLWQTTRIRMAPRTAIRKPTGSSSRDHPKPCPMNPPRSTPAIPNTIVRINPPRSSPGARSLTTTPTIRPNTIQPNIVMIVLLQLLNVSAPIMTHCDAVRVRVCALNERQS